MNALLRSLLVLIAVLLACLGPGCDVRTSDRTGDDDGKENADSSSDVEPTGDLLARVKWLIARTEYEDYDASDEAEEKLKGLFPDAAAPLLTLAKDPGYARRTLAIEILTWGDKLGPHEKQVHDFLRQTCQDDNAELRAAALNAMFFMDMPDVTKDMLKEKFKDPSAVVRKEIMNLLYCWDYSPNDRDLMLLLLQGLSDKNAEVSAEAVETLYAVRGGTRPVADELRKLTKHPDKNVRGVAITALSDFGPAQQDISTILTACKDPEVLVQIRALEAMLRLDPTSPQVTTVALAAFSDSEHHQVSMAAARILGSARPVKAEVVARLTKTIQDKSAPFKTRRACIDALWTMGPAASSATELLLKYERIDDFLIRGRCLRALGRIAPEHPELIKRVKALIASGDIGVLDLNYIIALGDRSSIFAADLINAVAKLPEQKSIVRGWIIEILPRVRGFSPKQAIPVLTALMTEDEGKHCDSACKTLGSMGADAAAAVPALIELTKKRDGDVAAINALGKIGPLARDVVPLLKKYFADPGAYKSKYWSTWHAAAEALARLDPASSTSVVKALRDELRSPDLQTQANALFRLGPLGKIANAALVDIKPLIAKRDSKLFVHAVAAAAKIGDLEPMIKLAIEEIDSDEGWRQLDGCKILSEIGPDARGALPILWKVWRRESDRTSTHAAGAIHAITGMDIWGKDGSRST